MTNTGDNIKSGVTPVYSISNSSLCCHWCGISLGNATKVTYLNGNLPVCDLCLIKANTKDKKVIESPFTLPEYVQWETS